MRSEGKSPEIDIVIYIYSYIYISLSLPEKRPESSRYIYIYILLVTGQTIGLLSHYRKIRQRAQYIYFVIYRPNHWTTESRDLAV